MEDYDEAAILIPLYEQDGEPYLLLTERSPEMPTHTGHISLPGGRPEDQDSSLAETALREAYEEAGIAPDDATITRELDPEETLTSGYRITPYAAQVPGEYGFTAGDEVATLIEAPISGLDQQEGADGMEYRYDGHRIWGATARILERFLDSEDPQQLLE